MLQRYFRYFIGIPPSHPGQRHLYRVSSVPQAGGKVHSAVCITCSDSSKTENRYTLAEGQNNVYQVGLNDGWTDKNDWNGRDDTGQKSQQTAPDEKNIDTKNKTKGQNESSEYVKRLKESIIIEQFLEHQYLVIFDLPFPSESTSDSGFLSEVPVTCQYHSAIFSPSYEYFVLECRGPGIPSVSLYKTEMPAPRFISLLQNNSIIHVSMKI